MNGGPAAEAAGPDTASPEEVAQRVQELMASVERITDPIARQTAENLVSGIVELYGAGLERIFAALDEDGEAGERIVVRLSEDDVVSSLMLIHGLFPVPLDERVVRALDNVRPYMESHGGNVELLGIDAGIARIRLEGSCEGCPASASTLELAITQALDEVAPDLEGLVVEGVVEDARAQMGDGALDLPVVSVAPGNADAEPAWFDLADAGDVAEGEAKRMSVEGIDLVVARVEGGLLAYRDACAGCGEPIAGGDLVEGVLACPSCGRRYFLPRAGRSMDDERLQLEPVPLLDGDGHARVALAA